MDWIINSVDTSEWPRSAQALWPHIVKWGLVLASFVLIWIASGLVRHIIRAIGKKLSKSPEEFEGSSWDLGASIVRFVIFLAMLPLPLGLMGYDWKSLVESKGPGAAAAIVTFIFAILLANWISRSLRSFGQKAHARAGTDDTLFAFFGSMAQYFIFAIAVIVALTQLGFSTASLAAMLGGAALAIGLALQDLLKAVAAGVMLAIFRPYRIGDYVQLAGIDGEVTDISPFTTSMKQVDNKIVTLTNDQVWTDAKINFTRLTRRRLDLYFDVSYDDDLDFALDVLKQVLEDHPRILSKHDNWVGVHALGDWSVKLRARAYCPTPEFVDVRSELIKKVKEAFDANGIIIPFPHQVEIQYRGPTRRSSKPASDEPDTPSNTFDTMDD